MRTPWMLLVLIPLTVLAQQYIEVSGQTKTFKLTAGAKAAWDNSSSGVIRFAATPAAKLFSVVCQNAGGNVRFSVDGRLPSESRLCIYSVSGQLLVSALLSQTTTSFMPKRLDTGYYLARIENASGLQYTAHFLITR